jgi:hypothetical protein
MEESSLPQFGGITEQWGIAEQSVRNKYSVKGSVQHFRGASQIAP